MQGLLRDDANYSTSRSLPVDFSIQASTISTLQCLAGFYPPPHVLACVEKIALLRLVIVTCACLKLLACVEVIDRLQPLAPRFARRKVRTYRPFTALITNESPCVLTHGRSTWHIVLAVIFDSFDAGTKVYPQSPRSVFFHLKCRTLQAFHPTCDVFI